jgi:hypothetical protein
MASIGVLAMALRGYDGSPSSDSEEFVAIAMMALGFPSSLVVTAVMVGGAAALDAFAGITLHVSRLSIVLRWMAFALVGYAQWFWLLPRVVRAAKGTSRPHPPS